MSLDQWILFWSVLCGVGFAGFYLVALVVLPLGLIDLIRLFRELRRRR